MFTQKNHPTTPNPRISCEGCDKKCEITACPIYNTRNEIIGYMPKIGNNIIFSYIDGNNTPRPVKMTPITHGPAKSTVEQLAFTISQYCDYQSLHRGTPTMFTQKNHLTRISCEGCDKKCEITARPIYNTRNEIIGYMPKIGNNIIFSYIDGNNTPRTVKMTPITHGPAKSTVEQLAFTISQYCDYHKQSLQKTK